MSEKNNSIRKLLKNISVGLQKYEIDELNEVLVKLISKKSDQNKEINYVLYLVSKEYEITQKTLTNSRSRGEIQQARKLAYCLLHYTLGMSIRQIAKLFGRYHNSIAQGLKDYKAHDPNKFRIDREFEEKLISCKTQLLTYMNKQIAE